MAQIRAILIWSVLLLAAGVAIAAALSSPLLAWRSPIYIIAGLAGVVGLALILFQPLLVGGHVPGVSQSRGRRLHRYVGICLLAAVIVHVAGLWITSPPDVIDALLFASPTPFSAWGVIAMWALFLAAALAILRRRWRWTLRSWRLAHTGTVTVIVVGTVVHAMLIEGTMEPISKAVLCLLAVLALTLVIAGLRVWKSGSRRRG